MDQSSALFYKEAILFYYFSFYFHVRATEINNTLKIKKKKICTKLTFTIDTEGINLIIKMFLQDKEEFKPQEDSNREEG